MKKDYLVIGKAWLQPDNGAPKGLMKSQRIELSQDSKLGGDERFFVTTKIGDENYAMFIDNNLVDYSIHKKFDFSKQKHFQIVKYRVTANELEIRQINLDEMSKVIKKGLLRGTLVDGESPVVTDSTENVIRFLKGGDSKNLFDDSGLVKARKYTREK